MTDAPFDLDRIQAISDRLDLRQPNREALESIVFATRQHYDIEHEPPTFEAVVDSATGVGKTFILAASIEYFAADGIRNFAVITPGRTILDKTVANFTPGHAKSLSGGMEVRPVLITSDDFDSPAMRSAMDDPEQVKLYVFTVQALIRPQTKTGRKTHEFREGLGEAFYAHLERLKDLVVFADEHHTYYGDAFSKAIRDMHPWVLLGLTATPHKKTPLEDIIYRYPLAAAIADRLVKTPVLVGRRDDRQDIGTQLLDGIRLLELKEELLTRHCQEHNLPPVHPVMLVIAQTIADTREVNAILTEPSFAGGRYDGKVLTVHSEQPDEALKQLDALEEPDSPHRIVVSVGMLKDGWDVKNVYVIASLRASVSEVLTEQTLGRGLRLPFGKYTGIERLDTLEVLGHERYQQLLDRAGIINQQFVDWRTRMRLVRDSQGEFVAVPETTQVSVTEPGTVTPVQPTLLQEEITTLHIGNNPLHSPVIQSMEGHTARAVEQVQKMQVDLPPRSNFPPLRIPQLKMTITNEFSLADITDLQPFRQLGERIASNPDGQLRRTRISARIVQGPDGLRRTELVTATAADRVASQVPLFPLEDLRWRLTEFLLVAPVVPARSSQRQAAVPIIDAFLKGLGPQAAQILSGYLDRAVAGLIELVTQEYRQFATRPSYGTVVEVAEFGPTRMGRPETSQDRMSAFKRGVGYLGFKKSLYAQDWFDSSTERAMANALEDADEIAYWVRLQRGDLPILWTEAREYNPDFIAVDAEAVHWVIEVKMDKEMQSADVQGKRQAAQRWANHVSMDEQVGVQCRYLLVSEADVETARGSWSVLKKLGGS